MAAKNSFLTESVGFFQRSSQGTKPFLLKVNLYQEIYNIVKPISPITPSVKDEESHGQENEIFMKIVLIKRVEPKKK